MHVWSKGWLAMAESPSSRPSKRSQRVKEDPLADLDRMITAAASDAVGRIESPAALPISAEEQTPLRAGETQDMEKKEMAPLTACPYLGTAEDCALHLAEPAPIHRCFGTPSPRSILETHQKEYCLSSDYTRCVAFISAEIAAASSATPKDKKRGGFLSRLLRRR